MSKISVKALIFRKDEILLLRPKNLEGSFDGWDIPGGHVKTEEIILDALKREVFEETRIKIKKAFPIKLVFIPSVDTDYLIFFCTTSTSKVVLSDEHVSYKWLKTELFRKVFKDQFTPELVAIRETIEKLLG